MEVKMKGFMIVVIMLVSCIGCRTTEQKPEETCAECCKRHMEQGLCNSCKDCCEKGYCEWIYDRDKYCCEWEMRDKKD